MQVVPTAEQLFVFYGCFPYKTNIFVVFLKVKQNITSSTGTTQECQRITNERSSFLRVL